MTVYLGWGGRRRGGPHSGAFVREAHEIFHWASQPLSWVSTLTTNGLL